MSPIQRLTALQINLIGLGIVIVLGLVLFLAAIKPKRDLAASTKADTDQIEAAGGKESDREQSKRDLTKAKADTKRINAQWAVDAATYMPRLRFGTEQAAGQKQPMARQPDLLSLYEFNGYKTGLKDLPMFWGRYIVNWYDKQMPTINRNGYDFPIGAVPANPTQIPGLTALTFPGKDPWKVTLTAKDFNAAMAHLRRFNSIHNYGMPVVDKVSLSGQSPNLQLSYELAMYVIPDSNPPGMDPKLGMESGSGGGGGGMGMGMMPSMGGPSMGGPSPMAAKPGGGGGGNKASSE